jgi:hypothetical protein
MEVQSYYQGRNPTTPMLTRGTVVAGRFMDGHKLIIRKDNKFFRGENAQFRGNTPNVIEWDHEPITPPVTKEISPGFGVSITKDGGNYVMAAFPFDIKVGIRQHGYYQDNYIWLPSMNEAFHQDGQCGDHNGDASLDSRARLQYNKAWVVDSTKNLFKEGVNVAAEHSSGKSLETCTDRAEHERECQKSSAARSCQLSLTCASSTGALPQPKPSSEHPTRRLATKTNFLICWQRAGLTASMNKQKRIPWPKMKTPVTSRGHAQQAKPQQ